MRPVRREYSSNSLLRRRRGAKESDISYSYQLRAASGLLNEKIIIVHHTCKWSSLVLTLGIALPSNRQQLKIDSSAYIKSESRLELTDIQMEDLREKIGCLLLHCSMIAGRLLNRRSVAHCGQQ